MNQATVRNDHNPAGATTRVASGVSSVVRDLVTLAELQAYLLAADFQESKRRLVLSWVFLLVGAGVLLASLSVALIALAQWFFALGLKPEALAYLAAAGTGIVLSVVVLALGWKCLRRAAGTFRRSQGELLKNLECIKASLEVNRR